jgi:t-SNARE complex subunit (syntaxin)
MQNFIPLYSQEEETKEKNEQSFKEILQITEYSNSLKKREEDLKQAQILSGQIVDITNHLKSEVNTQNEKLYEIDDNVLNVDKNVEKGLNELKQIEIITRASKKRLYFLIVFVVGVMLLKCLKIKYFFFEFLKGFLLIDIVDY